MATERADRPSKTAFVRQFLERDPKANRKAIDEAWRDAGHEGSISSALVSNLRSHLGLRGPQGGRSEPADGDDAAELPKARAKASKSRKAASKSNRRALTEETGAPAATKRAAHSGGRHKVLAEIEGDIDRLIFKLMAVGGLDEIEDELRKARRRLVVGSHEA
jgi:hypothetical protein